MAKDEEAPDWAKAEVAEAIRILKEDGLHIHKTYKAFMDGQNSDTEPPKEQDTEGQPPPAKDTPTEKPKKKGVWWADRSE